MTTDLLNRKSRNPELIWVLDDDGVFHFIAHRLLAKELPDNFKIIAFSSAEEAYTTLIQAENQKPRIILLDIKMPGMNGFQFLSQFQDLNCSANINVAAVSSSINEEDKIEAF